VPVFNYHQAYDGQASLVEFEVEAEQEWVVMMKPGTPAARMKGLCEASRNGCNLVGHAQAGVPFVELRGSEADLQAVLKVGEGVVKYVEPDSMVYMIPELGASGPGEASGAATWGLERIGANRRGHFGAGVTIFVLDTGIRSSHMDFTGRSSSALDMSSGSPVECTSSYTCAGDRQGHGTHCAATAAGVTYGVASEAAVKAVKVLSDQGSGQWSWSYYALDWLANNPARPAVASMSLGGTGNQQAMVDAVDGAVDAGVTVVVAAGNNYNDACGYAPAFVPSAITVGSTDSMQNKSVWSNWGACVKIWAPGSNVVSAGISSDTATDEKSGTSMACPHVSGGAALVLERNPTFLAPTVLEELLRTAWTGNITGLRESDTNKELYVGEGIAPPSPFPTPPPTPPPGSDWWRLTGGNNGCVVSEYCINSRNYPANYANGDRCTVEILRSRTNVCTQAFDTESSYDVLSINSTTYSGTSGPPEWFVLSGVLTWSSDHSVTKSGWKICMCL